MKKEPKMKKEPQMKKRAKKDKKASGTPSFFPPYFNFSSEKYIFDLKLFYLVLLLWQ